VGTPAERHGALQADRAAAQGCTRCPQLVASRSTVVFGEGNPAADLMFVGEAPGATEDREGRPFVGQAGRLLDQLLAGIGLDRTQVFLTSTLLCRPPGNRDPLPQEIANCRSWLHEQVAHVEPRVVCPLGNFATRLLRGDPTGVTKLHGRPELRAIGLRTVCLYPLIHPAAALYTPALMALLREDFQRIPELLAEAVLEQPAAEEESQPEPPAAPGPDAPPEDPPQLGLF